MNIKSLTKEDVGRWVRYTGNFNEIEDGRLKSWNDTFVFVVYKCDENWLHFEKYTGVATKPEDLEFIEPKL